jgi:hypothetical protein
VSLTFFSNTFAEKKSAIRKAQHGVEIFVRFELHDNLPKIFGKKTVILSCFKNNEDDGGD